MEQSKKSVVTDDTPAASLIYLTAISFERTDEASSESGEPLILAGLWVSGVPGLEDRKPFAITMTSPNCWEMKRSIELHAKIDVLDCIVKSDKGEKVASLRLDIRKMRTTNNVLRSGRSQQMEMAVDQIQLAMRWDEVNVPPKSIQVEACDFARQFNTRGAEHLSAFEQTGKLSDIDEAISLLRRVVDLTPLGHYNLPGRLGNLGSSLARRYERIGKLSDITEAISLHQRAVILTSRVDPDLPGRLSNLGNSFTSRFEQMGALTDISEAISIQQRAVQLTPQGHASLPAQLSSLGGSLPVAFKERRALELTPTNHGDLPRQYNNLGAAFKSRFERTGELADITEAIKMQQKALELTPHGHANLAAYLNNLGGSFMRRFQRAGDLADITEAISARQKAVELTPQAHADLPGRLVNLGNSLACRFERLGEMSDIAEAVSVQQKAVNITPQGHPGLAGWLDSLGGSFTLRFERTGQVSDIAEAISVRKRAVELTPQGHGALPLYLSNLGGSITRRFERTGEISDITEAISVRQRAVELTPQGHASLISYLNSLGGSLMRRFEWTGELSDMEEVVLVRKRAVELTPDGHADLHAYLNNLGNALTCRFERLGELSDIAETISVQHRAVELTPHGHADLPGQLSNLGASYTRRFDRTNHLSDIADAISVQQKAVKLTSEGDPDLPGRLNNLGNALTRKGALSDLTEAISVQQRAIELTPHGHAVLPHYHNNLGFSFYNRFTATGDDVDLENAIYHYKSAAISVVGPARARLDAARSWAGKLLRHRPQSPDIIPSFDTALGLVALIAGLDQTVRGRYTQLENVSGLALEAASAACALNRPDKALEWLEQGRCLVWNQLHKLRTPLDDLRTHDSELAESIASISKQLENAASSRSQFDSSLSSAEKISIEDEARAHLNLSNRWNDLLKTARAIPGFETFLMPSPCAVIMQNLPEAGPVVIINIDKHRCDALALIAGHDRPLHIPLPNFSFKKATKYRADLDSQLRSHHLRDRQAEDNLIMPGALPARGIRPAPTGAGVGTSPVHRVLRGLWADVVKPILDALGFSARRAVGQAPTGGCFPSTPIAQALRPVWKHVVTLILDTLGLSSATTATASDEVLPRIWWCPTGPLSFLPLHAAGIYGVPNPESVFDYAVSSYTPSVNAITERVKLNRAVDWKSSGLFMTSQPSVKGASPIHGTTTEVLSIFNRAKEFGVRVEKLDGDELSVAECLERMQNFSSIHLACHGSQNATEPLQSRFLFHQGSLALGTILQANLPHADLAFLSACQTSTGEAKLSDEAVHLAAGMLAAGYRRVVGTMWSIGDKPAQELATTFYEHLFTRREDGSDSGFNGTLSAHALHHATQKLRVRLEDSEKALLTWIPFVHFGY
ncbi:TPR-like protein [Ephemerocybe angulata]|uniref:TPR-like protein n=1 Tax=Ephemerocybe angulata TaxID=980116 RepID=A0A8H6HJM1_9AGAR|nr:TPR-like protein [Tulosesus angulatus]